MNCLFLHHADPRYESILSEHGISYVPVPVLQITYPTVDSASQQSIGHDGVIITSKYAVNYLVANNVHLSGKCLAVVGPNTAKLLHEYCALFQDTNLVWADNATQLASLILETFPRHFSWLFYCSNKALDIIPRVLRQNGVKLKQLVVYQTGKKVGFEEDLKSVSATKFDVVVFFSPSGVEFAFPAVLDVSSSDCMLVAFGKSTAAAISSTFGEAQTVLTCKHPTPSGLCNVLLEISQRR